MPDLARILAAKAPLTLSGIARGARAAGHGRSRPRRRKVARRLDRARRSGDARDRRHRALLRARTRGAGIPRVGLPALRSRLPRPVGQRAAAGGAAPAADQDRQAAAAGHHVNALLQRVQTPFRIRELVRLLKPGMEIGRESLIALLQRQGYSRTDTVVDAGEYAVRGSVFDIYPVGPRTGPAARFLRRRAGKPADRSIRTSQRSTGKLDEFLLLPASETLLDEAGIKRFRSRLSRAVRRDGDRRSALSGGQRRPAAGGDGTLAAAVRGAAGHACSTT